MSTIYQIRVKGHLSPHSAAWLGEFTLTRTHEGDTLLTGAVQDQAALYGIFNRCRDLGITLISFNPIQSSFVESESESSHSNSGSVPS